LLAGINPNHCTQADSDAQVLISADEGRTWNKHGLAIPGSAFQYVLSQRGKLWLAGEHIAEGPGSAPFFVRLSGSTAATRAVTIYDGAAELQGVALRSDGSLEAWVRHLSLDATGTWSGPLYLHRSNDEGDSWKTVGRVRSVPRDRPDLVFFRSVDEENPPEWRIQGAAAGGFVVQHKRAGQWETVSHFPGPAPCD
jgi:hypothetical protein